MYLFNIISTSFQFVFLSVKVLCSIFYLQFYPAHYEAVVSDLFSICYILSSSDTDVCRQLCPWIARSLSGSWVVISDDWQTNLSYRASKQLTDVEAADSMH